LGLSRLRDLNLEQCNQVTGAGIAQLVQLPALERLNLKQTGVDDAGLELLAGAPQLKYVDIRNTSISDAAIDKFKTAKPDCEVNY
jgi:hypothetical protein